MLILDIKFAQIRINLDNKIPLYEENSTEGYLF